jgi:hypothetical protein
MKLIKNNSIIMLYTVSGYTDRTPVHWYEDNEYRQLIFLAIGFELKESRSGLPVSIETQQLTLEITANAN